jgi:Domain of Unknown Function (DUF349)
MENVTLTDEYGYVLDGKVFLKGYLTYPDRQIGEVKRTDQEAIDYFKNRFNIAANKVEELTKEIEVAQNKGSFLTKLLQLRKKLLSFDGLGNFVPLIEKLEKSESYLDDLIKNNQEKNLEIKRALLADARAVEVVDNDWQAATDILQEIKSKWIRTGPVEKQYDEELEANLQQFFDDFFQNRRDYFSEQNNIISTRIETYQALLAKSDLLQRMYDVDEAAKQAKELRQQWKEVGEIPIKRSMKLYKQFKRSQQRISDKFNRVKGIVVVEVVHPAIEQQRKMVAEVIKLSKSDDIISASERTKALLNEWKEIRVPMKFADRALAERFRAACDKIFELSYLARILSRKYPALDIRDEQDQLEIKIKEMEWLIKREKGDLELTISSAQNEQIDEDTAKQTMNRINTQRRKIAMKETILGEFRSQFK